MSVSIPCNKTNNITIMFLSCLYHGSRKNFPRKKTPAPKPNPNLFLTLALTSCGGVFSGFFFLTPCIISIYVVINAMR